MLATHLKLLKKDLKNIYLVQEIKRVVYLINMQKKYGLRLKPRLYKIHNPFESKEDAMKMEIEKARRLRKRGYAVWQK